MYFLRRDFQIRLFAIVQLLALSDPLILGVDINASFLACSLFFQDPEDLPFLRKGSEVTQLILLSLV